MRAGFFEICLSRVRNLLDKDKVVRTLRKRKLLGGFHRDMDFCATLCLLYILVRLMTTLMCSEKRTGEYAVWRNKELEPQSDIA